MAERPIFYDDSGRRRRRFGVAFVAFIALLVMAAIAFAATIVAVAPQQQLPFAVEHGTPASPRNDFLHRSNRQINRAARAVSRLWRGAAADPNRPLAIGFHAPWDESSAASLQRHIDELDWLIPGWVSITGRDHHITVFPDTRGRTILARAQHRPVLLPMISNVINGEFDGPDMAALLHDPAQRARTLAQVEQLLLANQAQGAFFDLEELPDAALPDYRAFLAEARARFARHKWIVAMALEADRTDADTAAFAKVTDKLFLMAYDEHYQGGPAGPISSERWFEDQVARVQRLVPPDQLVVAVASYAYDWKTGTKETDPDSVEDAWTTARDSGVMPMWDPVSGESHYAYDDETGHHREVWISDAAAVRNRMVALHRRGVRSIALWRLGSEDPSLWAFYGRDDPGLPAAAVIQTIPFGTTTDIEGTGEILRVGNEPVVGRRRIQTDSSGVIIDERFVRLPSPYVVQRTGFRHGLLALTFDDGPDSTWTPQVLDVLKREHVPATFFVVGENALTQRGLLQRELAEGHEVGSHTYTHPNLAEDTPGETALELNANQRLFQAFTGRSLRLFRAPYFGDAEPTGADEIRPVAEAQRMGYLSVGLHVDPGDWKQPGVQAIVDATLASVASQPADCGEADADENCSRNIVLLHDAGGDRAQTVAALPLLIEALKAKGYRFVTISTLAGLSPAAVNPMIAASDVTAARADLALFLALGGIVTGLHWLFAVAITLGIARAVVLSGLALVQARREGRQVFPPIDPARRVTVLIPAFNEERVIERAVRRVLDSRTVGVSVIVIDDGSKDRTGAVVRAAFGDDPRVTLITLANGGKARALNTALATVESEIVIALDADTQFEPTTITRLARWFADPALGAVAGNAKVGNRVNLVSRWQALEYVTAQNLERRALARLNAMTVVPGAVGAWRTATLKAVGGYPVDTLAEDQDLTITIQRAGWRVTYDQFAVAWTEAPESFRGLAKQRFRWAFGTLQCLWKHGAVLRQGRPRGLARIGLPQAIVFQIVLAAVSPIIDLALIVSIVATVLRVQEHGWAQTQTDVGRMLTFWLIFTAIDVLSAVIAFALERRERWRLLWLLVPQRIGYRQVMYYVVLKALVTAVRGRSVGWGKLERSGRAGAGPGDRVAAGR